MTRIKTGHDYSKTSSVFNARFGFTLLPFLAVATLAPRAFAQAAPPETEAAPPPPMEARSETVTERGGPSGAMLWSGVLTLGLTYGAGVVVGGTSPRTADHDLFVPIVGPWMDLADRGGACGGPGQTSCNTETTYKVLVVADGIGQALGAFMMIDAFLNPETRTVSRSTAAAPTLHLTPTSMGVGGYGMAAVGSF
ncbi:MAG: hypothetical protein ACRELB_14735 [Polyangiaceae bacterium]